MEYRLLLSLTLLLVLSGCGVIVYPDSTQAPSAQAWSTQKNSIQASVSKHEVEKGETLYSIAYRYGIEVRTLARWNNIKPPFRIFVGQELILKPQIRHRVKKGETLYAIAFKYGVNVRTLALNNAIKAPYKIYVGDNLTIIPQANSSENFNREQNTPSQSVVLKTQKRIAINSNNKRQANRQTKNQQSYNSNRKAHWGWPARGKVVTTFSPKDHRKGIDIRGKVGNKVVAADSGNVVYSGNGLLGYGNLIIIRHNSSYLSAYGHNRKLLVKEGVKVAKGEKIAEMGSTRKKGAILHFEIRRNGKPVNPVRYLPK
ncbi:MAG: peptidoglycan DD-metalloendopeptidase family protein [Gammaproteobacteria bacterium]|nr:peptidoglycan DD-metalloendopeptidase family protein [Gammaproteobacteria bacterium]